MEQVKSMFGMNRRNLETLVVAGVTGAVAFYCFKKYKDYEAGSKLPSEWEEVGKICNLSIYPVKSAKGIAVKSATATKHGLANDDDLLDRSFVVVTDKGAMITGRNAAMLVTMVTKFAGNILTITDLKGKGVDVDVQDVINRNVITKFKIRGSPVRGLDCGEPVASFLSERLFEDGTKLRLMYVGNADSWQRPKRDFAFFDFPNYKNNDTTLYFDTTSYNICTEASLADLNSRITDSVNMGYFRPTLVVKGPSAFDEDTWDYIKIGKNVILHTAKPCERCKLTTVNPDNGEERREHFEELLRYRVISEPSKLAKEWKEKPIFGLHCGIDICGTIKVGDPVMVSRLKQPYWKI